MIAMLEFGLGFLCCAVICLYIQWRTPSTQEPPTVMDKVKYKPNNKLARECSTEAYRAEQKWVREHGKKIPPA